MNPEKEKENEEKNSKHWAENLAELAVEGRKAPYIVSAGMTTSGPTHLGTLCEFLFPFAISECMKKAGNKNEFYFVADIYDAFDAIPRGFEQYKELLEPHLGKPLSEVPDPLGCCPSFGDHFLKESLEVMEKLGVKANVVKASDIYKRGKWDDYAKFFLKNKEKAREIVSKTSLNSELPKDWSPLMVVCENCGKIATTSITESTEDSYKYSCIKKLKYVSGCGHKGENKLADHKYKLTWRLHWPTWMDYFKTSIEGAGMDHHTRGGSWDTCKEVIEQLFKKKPPIGFKFGFVLLGGKKYSKSQGIGMGVRDILNFVPPEVIKYALFRPDVQENKDFDPTGNKLLLLMDDFVYASALNIDEPLSRADRKKSVAFALASNGKINWKAQFADIILYHQIYRDWKKVGEMLKDPKGVEYLRPFIENWLKAGYAPE
ncbi:MAG: lysine--tRNA ligase, partial [Candidatus Micrarchaeota archaeon]